MKPFILICMLAIVATMANAQSALPVQESQRTYVITKHTNVLINERDYDYGNRQEDLYSITYGPELLTVRYSSSQTSSESPGNPPHRELQPHDRHFNPDLSQIPSLGTAINACLVRSDPNFGTVITRQPTPAPCIARIGNILQFEPSPNSGDFTDVVFEILSETTDSVASSHGPTQTQEPHQGTRGKDTPNSEVVLPVETMSHRWVCLDELISTVETPFLHPGGDSCHYFVVQVPLSLADAELLQGRSTDAEMLDTMESQAGNALEIRTVIQNQQSAARSMETKMPQLIGAIWEKFQANRDAFCSRHPTMFVLDMKLDGTTTPPMPCAAQSKPHN